jgi:predicted protein tyrosine phosphatase
MLQSLTGKQVFSRREDLEVYPAGTKDDTENPLTAELVSQVDLICVMRKAHRSKLQPQLRAALADKRAICFDVMNSFAFMQPELVGLLASTVSRHLPASAMDTEKRSNLKHE